MRASLIRYLLRSDCYEIDAAGTQERRLEVVLLKRQEPVRRLEGVICAGGHPPLSG